MNESDTSIDQGKNADAKVLLDHLREAREQKGWSLEELADRTRISLDVLSNLEAGRFTVVEPPYVRAFLRTYAKAVGVPIEEVNAVFPEPRTPVERPRERVEQRSAPVERAPVRPVIEEPLPSYERKRGAGSVIAFIVILVLAAIAVAVWQPWKQAEQGETLAPVELPSDTVAQADTAAADSVAMPRPGEQPVLSPVGGQPLSQTPGARTRTITLEAAGTVWVQLAKRDSVFFDAIMTPGLRRSFTVQDSVRVTIGRYSAVRFYVDGQQVDVPHDAGDRARFLSTPTGLVKR